MDSATIFDKPYSKKKQDEDQAIAWAVANGKCALCKHLKVCRNYAYFVPPGGAACMKKKAEILRSMEG